MNEVYVANTDELRIAIQLATSTSTIILNNPAPYNTDGTFVRLAQRSSYFPTATYQDGYTIRGLGLSQTLLYNTRIFQQNAEPNAPGAVQDLTLKYTLAGSSDVGQRSDGGSLLRSDSGSFLLQRLKLTGEHTGVNGEGFKYISITPGAANPANANLTLDQVFIDITGQGNFNPATEGAAAGGSSFLHSWNNIGAVRILDSTFDEAGYLSAFNFLTYGRPDPLGTVDIQRTLFTRTNHQGVVRHIGNRLRNVNASLTGNTFEQGSYLDLYGHLQPITLTANTFKTVAGGYGIRIHAFDTSDGTVRVGVPTLAGAFAAGTQNSFTGSGLPLKIVDARANQQLTLAGPVHINGVPFTRMTGGGQANDLIALASGFADWVNGDDGHDAIAAADGEDWLMGGRGADTLSGGEGVDTFVFQKGDSGNSTDVDEIVDFSAADLLLFREAKGAPLITKEPTKTNQYSVAVTWADNTTEAFAIVFANGFDPTSSSPPPPPPPQPPAPPTISLVLSPASVAENGSANLIYTFSRTGPAAESLTVNYTLGGTAQLVASGADGADYTLVGQTGTSNQRTLSFAAGSATATVVVDPIADISVEPDETVSFTLSAGTGYTIGTPSAVTGTIVNSAPPPPPPQPPAPPTISLAVSPASVAENGSASLIYTFSRTGATTAPFTVSYTVAGTATLGVDYTGIGLAPATKTITFAAGAAIATVVADPTADSTAESNETVSLTLAARSSYTIGTPSTVSGTLLNDDLIGTFASNTIIGSAIAEFIDGRQQQDRLTGGGAGDVFAFRFGHSTIPSPDRITDFQIGVDKIDVFTGAGGALPAPAGLTRAANNSTARTLSDLATSVFRDANGAVAGNQALGANRAAVVVATRAPIAGTYLFINDGSAARSNSNDLLINITGFSGGLPGPGVIPVGSFFA